MIATLVTGALVGATAAAAAWASRRERAAAGLQAGRGTSAGVPSWFVRALAVAEVRQAPERAWPLARWTVLGLLAVLVVASPRLVVVALVLTGIAVTVAPRLTGRRAPEAYERELVSVVEGVTASLRGGASLSQAVAVAARAEGQVAADLAVVVGRAGQGEALQVGLDGWAHGRPQSGARLVADALALAGASGGSGGGALAGVAATLRERAALRREVRALGSQARASAVVLVASPVAFTVAVSLLDARVAGFLVGSAAGWACLVLGFGLDVAGAWWMSRLLGALR